MALPRFSGQSGAATPSGLKVQGVELWAVMDLGVWSEVLWLGRCAIIPEAKKLRSCRVRPQRRDANVQVVGKIGNLPQYPNRPSWFELGV